MSLKNELRRIYVACLASYNAGILHGVWIDCDGKDADELQDEVAAMLRSSPEPNVMVNCPAKHWHGEAAALLPACPTCKGSGEVPSAEEWAIHDHEGFGNLEEYTSLERVAELCRMLDEHDDAWLAYVETVGEQYASEENFNDAFAGEFDSKEDWAERYADDTGLLESVPENLRCYFDMERFARDCELGGDISFSERDGRVFAFHNV